MQRRKDKELKKKRVIVRHYKHDDKNPKTRIPKRIRTRKLHRYQIPGTRLKFLKNTPLTKQLKGILGRGVFKIVPPEIKQPGNVPIISVFLDKENRTLVLRVDKFEHEDFIVTDENGNATFVPDTEFKK